MNATNQPQKPPDALPRVSIVIPVFNGASLLGTAIKSALAQTYANCEIIVVDDNSDDNGATERVAKSFGPAVRYYQKPNGGVASALNFGVAQMRGELFSWLSHDDIYTPDKIEREVVAHIASGRRAVVYSDFFVMAEDGTRLYAHQLPEVPAGGMRCFLAESSALHGCTLLIPRAYLEQAGGFDETLKITQDYAMWFRLATIHPFVHIDAQLVGVRFHGGQMTANLGAQIARERDELYCGFLAALDEEEIKTYAGRDVLAYYLRLYRHFRVGDLRQATRIVWHKALVLMRCEPYTVSAFAHVAYTGTVRVPLARARALAKRTLLGNDLQLLTGMIVSGGRRLGVLAHPAPDHDADKRKHGV